MIRVLFVTTMITLLLGITTDNLKNELTDLASILIALVIIVSIASGSKYVKEQNLKNLSDIAIKKTVNVIRRGEVRIISEGDLVVGDIQMIKAG
jgi:magnesium-transporting ATPase (P-type)